MVKFIVVCFFALAIAAMASADLTSCMTNEYKQLVSKTIPNLIDNVSVPASCNPVMPVAITNTLHDLGNAAIPRCSDDLLCYVETIVQYKIGMVIDDLECARDVIINGPILMAVFDFAKKVDICFRNKA